MHIRIKYGNFILSTAKKDRLLVVSFVRFNIMFNVSTNKEIFSFGLRDSQKMQREVSIPKCDLCTIALSYSYVAAVNNDCSLFLLEQ
jgi:hypothetical protein